MKNCPFCFTENKDESILCFRCYGLLTGEEGEQVRPEEIKAEKKFKPAVRFETWEQLGTADTRVNQERQASAAWAFVLVWTLFLGSVFLAAWYALDNYRRREEKSSELVIRDKTKKSGYRAFDSSIDDTSFSQQPMASAPKK